MTKCRLTYNKADKTLDAGNLRATDYKYNRFIHLPNSGDAKKESLHEFRRIEMAKCFDRVMLGTKKKGFSNKVKRDQKTMREKKVKKRESYSTSKQTEGHNNKNKPVPGDHQLTPLEDLKEFEIRPNLSVSEQRGMKSLKERVASGEIIITETDKSKRFAVLTLDQYIKAGMKHTGKDKQVKPALVKQVQKHINDNVFWLSRIFNCGENWNQSDRVQGNMQENSEIVAPMYLLIKDHKKWSEDSGEPPPSRPVCEGNQGSGRHLSEIISLVLEPLAHALPGADVDSTGDLLSSIEEYNNKGERDVVLAPGVTARDMLLTDQPPSADTKRRPGERHRSMFNFCSQDSTHRKKRIEVLRSMKLRGSEIPNIKAKLEASKLLDEDLGSTAIKVEDPKKEMAEPKQKEGLVLVGNDVEALFPSIKDVEGARMVRCAIEKGELNIENVNYDLALRYLRVTGGKGFLHSAGLGRLEPKWKGSRDDLITIGGESTRDDKNWYNRRTLISKVEKNKIVARTIEVAILVAMGLHLYSFGGQIYIQLSGGPIGLRFTACLAAVLMKIWDVAWLQLLQNEDIRTELYKRYVDDSRNLLKPLAEGWYWDNDTNHFEFCPTKYEADIKDASYEQDQKRTTHELTQAMCSLVSFLRMTGEDYTQFEHKKLPTLDTDLWVEGDTVKYSFFEKPTVPNRVLQYTTALSEIGLKSSMVQEVVRRLQNCSESVELEAKQRTMSCLAQKLCNSGYPEWDTKAILIEGALKYKDKLRRSKLQVTDPHYKPLHLSKTFNESNRQLDKYMAKSSFYNSKKKQHSLEIETGQMARQCMWTKET